MEDIRYHTYNLPELNISLFDCFYCNNVLFTLKIWKENFIISRQNFWLTAHNWQKWKKVFLTCPCNEIYRVEAVGLKVLIILEKL